MPSGRGHEPVESSVFSQQQRRRRVEKMMMHGHHNKLEMAAAFHVEPNTIYDDVKAIRESWLTDNAEDAQARAVTRTREIDYIRTLCMNEFERSKQSHEEYSVVERPCDHPQCNQGIIKDKKDGKNKECPRCFGTCKLIVETKKVSAQCGDVRYLSVAKDCIVECARIEGLYPTTASVLKKMTERTLGPDGEITERVQELFIDASEDVIIRLKAELEAIQVKSRVESKTPLVIDIPSSSSLQQPTDG